jgi:hypothetical protein
MIFFVLKKYNETEILLLGNMDKYGNASSIKLTKYDEPRWLGNGATDLITKT